jgi:hypothetical protein
MFSSRSFWNRLKLTNYSLSVVLLVPFVLLITGTVGLVSYSLPAGKSPRFNPVVTNLLTGFP